MFYQNHTIPKIILISRSIIVTITIEWLIVDVLN